jgi:hypothetical protein
MGPGVEVTCLDKILGDQVAKDFGFSLAAEGDRVAIGEPSANRVHLLQHEKTGDWRLLRTITHPKLELLNLYGNGFGHSVALSEKKLIIGDYVLSVENNIDRRLQRMQVGRDAWIRRSGVYLVDNIHSPSEILELFSSLMPSESEFGFAVAASETHIAASFAMLSHEPTVSRTVKVASRGGVVVAPIRSLIQARVISPPTTADSQYFGRSIDLDEGRLIASVNSRGTPGAWVIDLTSGVKRRIPEKETDFRLPVESVSLSGTIAVLNRPAMRGGGGVAQVIMLGEHDAKLLAEIGPSGRSDSRGDLAVISLNSVTWPEDQKQEQLNIVVVKADGFRKELRLRDWKGMELKGPPQAVAVGSTHIIVSRGAPSGSCRVFALPIPTVE